MRQPYLHAAADVAVVVAVAAAVVVVDEVVAEVAEASRGLRAVVAAVTRGHPVAAVVILGHPVEVAPRVRQVAVFRDLPVVGVEVPRARPVVGAALRVHRPVAEEAVLRVLLNSRRGVAARRRPRHNALRVAIDRRPEVVTVPRNFRRAIARAVRIGLAARIGPAAQTVPAVRIVRVEQIVPEARIARVRARAIVLHSFRPIVPVLALVTAPGLTAPVQELVIAQTKAT